jgi:hypothetical protein
VPRRLTRDAEKSSADLCAAIELNAILGTSVAKLNESGAVRFRGMYDCKQRWKWAAFRQKQRQIKVTMHSGSQRSAFTLERFATLFGVTGTHNATRLVRAATQKTHALRIMHSDRYRSSSEMKSAKLVEAVEYCRQRAEKWVSFLFVAHARPFEPMRI